MDSTGAATLSNNLGTATVTGTGISGVSGLSVSVLSGWYYIAAQFKSNHNSYYYGSSIARLNNVQNASSSYCAWKFGAGSGSLPASISTANLIASLSTNTELILMQGQ